MAAGDDATWISFDGSELSLGRGSGRDFMVDPRCVEGAGEEDVFAHVCALPDPSAALPYDHPEVQQVRRDCLAWWIPLLGDRLVCLTTLALDEAGYGGAITITREPVDWTSDPFARIFPGTIVRSGLFGEVPPPAGPVIERYAGVAWPGGRFS